MQLPTYRRIQLNDYPQEYQALMNILAGPINNAFTSVFSVLNNQVSLQDQLAGQVSEVTVNVNAAGTPSGNTVIALNTNFTVLGTTVINAINTTTPTIYPVNYQFINWTQSGQSLNIVNVSGLQPNNNYTLTVVVYANG